MGICHLQIQMISQELRQRCPILTVFLIFILININTRELLTVSGIPTTLPCITTVKQLLHIFILQ